MGSIPFTWYRGEDSWNANEEIEIIRILSDTNFRLRAKQLCIVSPDDLSDKAFLKLIEIEKRSD